MYKSRMPLIIYWHPIEFILTILWMLEWRGGILLSAQETRLTGQCSLYFIP